MRMENWKIQGENHNQMRSQTWKNPSLGNRQQSVPSWEKKFCWEVGAVPWKRLLETKKLIHTYDNILGWKDSAAKEAFDNAKARYWAELKGHKCNIPKPDPDTHIDNVDWSNGIDIELILDLDRDDVVTNDMNRESVLIFPEGFGKSQEVGTDDGGWAQAEVGFKIPTDTDLENNEQDKDWGYNNNYRGRSGAYMSRYNTRRFNIGNGNFIDGDHNPNCRINQRE